MYLFRFHLTDSREIDEKSLTIDSFFVLEMTWFDPRLVTSETKLTLEILDYLFIHDFWRPSTYITNLVKLEGTFTPFYIFDLILSNHVNPYRRYLLSSVRFKLFKPKVSF